MTELGGQAVRVEVTAPQTRIVVSTPGSMVFGQQVGVGGAGGGVSSVNGKVGAVALSAADVGAETPAGAQAKADAASGADRARANHTGTQPASTVSGLAAVATSGDYADIGNRPTAFPPAPHEHSIADVPTLQDALDSAGDTATWAGITDKPTIPDSADDIGALSAAEVVPDANLPAYAKPSRIVPAGLLRAWGHSIMYGSTTTVSPAVRGVSDQATLLAQSLALPVDNRAVSGAALYSAASTGDWADVLQAETRGQVFEPRGGAFAVMYGINDGANLGATSTAVLAPFKEALRLIVSRLRCAATFEDSHASVTYGGSGWATSTISTRNSGTTVRYNNAASTTVTITLPSNFPGGTVAVGLPTAGDGGGATWTTTVNSTVYTADTSAIALSGTHATATVLRIPNVKRTQGTIALTVSSVTGSGGARAIFDWWGWEPDEAACPIVALISQPKPLDYTSQAGAPAGPVGDAGVDIINGIIAEVADEFGERTIYVDTSGIDKSAAHWEAGNIHPNAAGHAYLAAQTADAIEQAVTIVPSPVPAAVIPGEWATYTPTLDGTGTTQGDAVVTGSYAQSADSVVQFESRITLGATTVIGSTMRVSLPVAEKAGTIEIGRLEVRVFRSGSGYWELIGQLGAASGKVQLRLMPATPSTMLASPTATTPLTWAANDVLYVTGTYRAA